MINPAKVTATPSPDLLTPANAVMLLADYQPQMFFATGSDDRNSIINAVEGLSMAAKVFDVPVVLTTVTADSFAGPMLPALSALFPDQKTIDRTSMNAWEDDHVVEAIKATRRSKIIIAGLWTEVCVVLPTLSAINQGYEVYVVTDACGGTTPQAHERAIQRILRAGAAPTTWLQVLLELQRDWAHTNTYDNVMRTITAHGGAYGQGILYAERFLSAHTASQDRPMPQP